jgi:DNA (cytosine-5)-methyltransferase 1
LGENKRKNMTHGSLFSGIGGFDLAAEWMGWENKFHCEWNEFGQKVLKYANSIDILTGGFPCQPFSVAGERQGVDDPRHLFPQMLRAVREIKPRWIVAENVYGITSDKFKTVFEEIYTSLEAEGYKIQTFIIPASAVGAPHQRNRVWFVANADSYADSNGLDNEGNRSEAKRGCKGATGKIWQENKRECFRNQLRNNGNERTTPNPRSARQQECNSATISERQGFNPGFPFKEWNEWPTVPPVCNGNDGLPSGLDTEAIQYIDWRNESIKAGGNAIVPQVAYSLFKAIQEYADTI